jgi:hypothetical protein
MRGNVLDSFEDLSGWTAIASGQAQLTISQDQGPHGKAMRLDFDFCGGGGFVVARKPFPLELPESYSFSFQIRGDAPSNIFEFKLMDASDKNVWRYRAEGFDFNQEWQQMHIGNSQMEFAWGPLGGGPAGSITTIELVIAAGPGGKGTVWIDNLQYSDDTYRLTPVVEASSALPGHEPHHIITLDAATCWRSTGVDKNPRILIDFLEEREYGGMVIQWDEGFLPGQFDVEISSGGDQWRTVYEVRQGTSDRSYLYLPGTRSRYIRLNLLRAIEGSGIGIRSIEIKPYDFSRSINHFFQSIARDEQEGLYPKYLLNRQTYWTLVGSGRGDGQALFNEEGMVEVDKGSFSIAPFLYSNGRLISWADAQLKQDLTLGYLPIPSCEWQAGSLTMNISAFMNGDPGKPVLFIRYGIENRGEDAQAVTLFAALLPFQVTPTWQHWRSFGGVGRIRELSFRDGTVWVNDNRAVIPLSPPTAFGAAVFDQGTVGKYLLTGDVPSRLVVYDGFGYASGALRFDLEGGPGSSQEIYLAIPSGPVKATVDASFISRVQNLNAPEQLMHAVNSWTTRLAAIDMRLPPEAKTIAHTVKTAAAHILINRDGPALHPGPRRYSRSWIRDGIIMGAALLRLGRTAALRDFIRWYADYQAEDGALPDCADREGTEWLPEFDAYGQLIFGVMEYYRFTGDRAFLEEMQPTVRKTVAYLEDLRSRRLTAEYRAPEKKDYYGLLPESMSHEGYMAHPVHAYWDDFWAIRGLRDAANMEGVLGDTAEASRLAALRDSLSEDVRASLSATIARHGIDFVPGSVEFGDFDPAATANAIVLLDLLHLLPPAQTCTTFDKYLAGFRERASGSLEWNNYTAYEIRIIGALVRLGRRREAAELTAFMLADRRIPAWNQWPEISWRDPLSPSFMGDLPHTWISAEYILAICSMFAYEREADQSLVVAAGVSPEWLRDGFEVGVEDLSTYYGKTSYGLRLEDSDTLHFNLRGGITVPQGGIVVMPPLPRPIREMEVNGGVLDHFTPESFTLYVCPAEAVVKF